MDALPNPRPLDMPRAQIPDFQMATWDAGLHPGRGGSEGPEGQV